MNPVTVIHHSADFDGIFCREIARKFLPDAELIGWDYGDPKVPFPAEGTVYVLDLSPECFVTKVVEDWQGRFVWIDHHKSAISKFSGYNISGFRIDGVAACRLAWQWFCNSRTNYGKCKPEQFGPKDFISTLTKEHFVNRMVEEPYAVRLVGEYDIWDKRDPLAELLQHGLRSQELKPEHFDYLFDTTDLPASPSGMDTFANVFLHALLDAGKAIQYAKQKEDESVITKAGFTVRWEGLTFLCCNHARFNSFLFTAGIKPEHDALMGFCWNGRRWKFSLYHAPGREQHDLSLIAQKYGGGGHRGACGFEVSELPFPLEGVLAGC